MSTETVARLLVRGYNRHIKDHGPDSSHAGEVAETAGGHGFTVSRDGAHFTVRVERAKDVTFPADPAPAPALDDWEF
jgi:hypothetical protein